MVVGQYDICLIDLDPTKGHEIQKVRPCVVLSPDEMNQNIETVIIAPMTTKSHEYPTRVKTNFQNKTGWIILDQIRSVDRRRIINISGKLDDKKIARVKKIIMEMLVD